MQWEGELKRAPCPHGSFQTSWGQVLCGLTDSNSYHQDSTGRDKQINYGKKHHVLWREVHWQGRKVAADRRSQAESRRSLVYMIEKGVA